MQLIKHQNKHFKSVKFVDLSISCFGVFSKEYHAFLYLREADIKWIAIVCVKRASQ